MGIESARGRIICFIDSDCTVKPQWLDCMLAAFEDPAVGAACGAVYEVPPTNWAERATAGECFYGNKDSNLIETNMAIRGEVAKRATTWPEESWPRGGRLAL